MNIGMKLKFTKSPETQLQINANAALCQLDV